MTADDLPSPMPRFGPQLRDRPVLAVGETKYHGDPVAAVAAETRELAEEAAALVRVEFEALPAVSTIAAALDPASPLVQDPSIRPDDPLAGTNVLREHRYGWGDLEAAERDAAVVIDGTYTFPMVTQFAIEPHAFMAAPDGDGMAIWSSIQHPYWLQRVVATMLGLPLAKVRVFAPDPGGGFGGKQHAKYEPLLAFMARKAGRPVRLVLSLEETFQAVRRAASEIRVRIGVPGRRHDAVPRHRGGLPRRRVRGHRGPRRRQGHLHRRRAVHGPAPPASSRAASCRTRCRRPPSAASATRSRSGRASRTWTRRRCGSASTRSSCACATSPIAATRSCPGTSRPTASGPRPSRPPRAPSAGARRCRRGAAAAWPSGSRRGRRPASRTRPSGCSPTAASSSTRAPRTWARAPARSSRRSPPTSSAPPSSGSRWSWATRPSCPTTSRRRRAGRRS